MDKFLKGGAGAARKQDQVMTEDQKPVGDNYVPWVEKYRPSKIEEISH